jgi:DNA-directed RNA polymerase subunit RPC12/RpoP
VIHLACRHCGAKLKVPEAHAGKTGRCPHCQGRITIPPLPASEAPPSSVLKPADSEDPAYDAALLDLAPKGGIPKETVRQPHRPDRSAEDAQESAEQSAGAESEAVGGLGLPWFIDMFLYPLDLTGVIHLVSLWLLVFLLCPFVMGFLGLGTEFAPIVYTLPAAYVVYYLAECIRDGANGGRHPPDFWMNPVDPNRWEVLSQFLFVLGCVAVCFWPVSVYYIFRERADWAYWLLMAGGDFFFPMVLLAVVVFDSYDALNPLLIVGSILRTFLPYCGLVLLLTAGAVLLVKMNFRFYSFRSLPWGPFFIRAAQLYLLFVAVGLLGRFYRRYKKKLDWGV